MTQPKFSVFTFTVHCHFQNKTKTQPSHLQWTPVLQKNPTKIHVMISVLLASPNPSSAGVVGPVIHNVGQRRGVLFVCFLFLFFLFYCTHMQKYPTVFKICDGSHARFVQRRVKTCTPLQHLLILQSDKMRWCKWHHKTHKHDRPSKKVPYEGVVYNTRSGDSLSSRHFVLCQSLH